VRQLQRGASGEGAIGHDVDILQRSAQCAARGRLGMGKIDHLDAERSKVAFEPDALLGTLPVIALEQDVEPQLLLDLRLVVGHGGMRHVDKLDVANDLGPFGKRNYGRDFLVLEEHHVGGDACDQEFATFLCLTQEIEMADMEQIEGTWRITDADHCSDLLIAAFVTIGNLSGLQERRAPVSAFQFDIKSHHNAAPEYARGLRCVRIALAFSAA
jgi:hypothetical protein